MSDFPILYREQFIIPSSPQVLQDGYIGLESDGTQYDSSTETEGDSYYTTFQNPEGPGLANFRFEIHLELLTHAIDFYYIECDASTIPGEFVVSITRFNEELPTQAIRMRLNLEEYPYTTFKFSSLSGEGNIEAVSFDYSAPKSYLVIGAEERGREWFFMQVSGLAKIRIPWEILSILHPTRLDFPRRITA